jgi:hypothetical protein
MHETLQVISAARRLRARKARLPQTDHAAGIVTPIEAGRARALDVFARDVHVVRESIFALADSARESVPHDLTQLHVSLQVIANELGQVERTLSSAREAAPNAIVRAS